jgi:S-DNA-T family DNA segregation ATPase FtsK/SpoIIIE
MTTTTLEQPAAAPPPAPATGTVPPASDTGTGTVPVGPALSMFDPVFIGIDEYGDPVYVTLMYRNLLVGGEPGGGKSTLLSSVVAHAALSTDCRLCLLDGKQVELGLWADVADVFVGPDTDHAITTLRRLQVVMNNRYRYLLSRKERKIGRGHSMKAILLAVDEIAYFSATVGTKQQQEEFVALLRDLVARGRAVGIIVVAATQRPSVDIIPTSLRDIFGYRFATRCTTEASSDIILGRGWADQGYNAQRIAPEDQGVGLLIAEGGTPRLVKAAYLTDTDIIAVARFAAWTRTHHTTAGSEQPIQRARRPAPHPSKETTP